LSPWCPFLVACRSLCALSGLFGTLVPSDAR
jgi:hypothetical protein